MPGLDGNYLRVTQCLHVCNGLNMKSSEVPNATKHGAE